MAEYGPSAFDQGLLFNEAETLRSNIDFIKNELSNLKVVSVEIEVSTDQNIIPGQAVATLKELI